MQQIAYIKSKFNVCTYRNNQSSKAVLLFAPVLTVAGPTMATLRSFAILISFFVADSGIPGSDDMT